MKNKVITIVLCVMILMVGAACDSGKSGSDLSSNEKRLYSSFNVHDFLNVCMPELVARVEEPFADILSRITDAKNGEDELRYYGGAKHTCMNCGEASVDLDVTSAKKEGDIASISISSYNGNGICEVCIKSFADMTIPPIMTFLEGKYNERKLEQVMNEMCSGLQFDKGGKVSMGYGSIVLENDMKCSILATKTSVIALFEPTENEIEKN